MWCDHQSERRIDRGSSNRGLFWNDAPRHLIRDRDRAFGTAYTKRIRAMGIPDHPVAARPPWQNGEVERLIGSVRCECPDHFIGVEREHLRRILKTYASYDNGCELICRYARTRGAYAVAFEALIEAENVVETVAAERE